MEKIKVKEWIDAGNLDGTETDSDEILSTTSTIMDKNETQEILGPIFFIGEDGKYYHVSLETVIRECDKDFATGGME